MDQLIKRHEILSQRVGELERKLLKLSQFEMDRNKDRADLLLRGLKLSQNTELVSDLQKTLQLIKQGNTTDLGTALKNQKKILEGLSKLYDLLESNNLLKLKRNKAEQIRQKIDVIEQLIQRQSLLRQRINNESSDVLKNEQERIRKETGDVETSLQNPDTPDATKNSTEKNPESAGNPDTNKETDSTENKSREEKVVEDLKGARQQMQNVETDLSSGVDGKTAQKMEQAAQKLAEAKQKLHEILKQNREEEIESTLRTLEERFKWMLQMQLKINEDTVALKESEKPVAEVRIQSFQLSTEQRKVILEIEKALLILNEEGSSTAFPGTLYHVKLDLQDVVNQLELADLDSDTVRLQKEAAMVLAELVKSVQQEQTEQKKLKNTAKPAAENAPEQMERPLVQKLAELKIIKQLQLQINERHKSYAESHSKTQDQDLQRKIGLKTKRLSERQKLLEEMTLELIKGASQ